MNGYNLIRDWYNYKFDNPSKVKAIHSDFYCYLIDLWNRLGQKNEFGLPTTVTMEALGIGSYNTYKKTLSDIIEFGFVNIITESKNQHQSKVIALSKNDKATDKPLDKATIKATDESLDTIDKQINNITNKQKTISFAERKKLFLDWFNHRILIHTGKIGRFKVLDKATENNLKKVLDVKYNNHELEYAFKNMYSNQWVKDNNALNPTHFLRIANLEKYMNMVDNSNTYTPTIELN
jgi:hypothetical protein